MKSTLKPPVSAVELHPVHGRRATDEQQLVLVEVEQDAVADDVAVVAASGTICFALSAGKLVKLLMVRYEQSLSASGPLMVSSAMWCDWSNSTAVSRQARCSSRQLVNSLGTTG